MSMVIVQAPNSAPALKVATLNVTQKLHLRLLNSVSTDNSNLGTIVRFGKSRDVLDLPVAPSMPQNGHRLLQSDGMIEMQWDGDVYLEGTTGNTVLPQVALEIN
jgi:hypothetical protein